MQQLRPVDTATGADAIRSPAAGLWLHTSEPSPAPSVGLARFWRPVARGGAGLYCRRSPPRARVDVQRARGGVAVLSRSAGFTCRGGVCTTLVRPGSFTYRPDGVTALRRHQRRSRQQPHSVVSPASLARGWAPGNLPAGAPLSSRRGRRSLCELMAVSACDGRRRVGMRVSSRFHRPYRHRARVASVQLERLTALASPRTE